MILALHAVVRSAVRDAVARRYALDADRIPEVSILYPPDRALGDLGVTVAFELARVLRKAPRVIAAEIVEALGPVDGVARVEPAPNGYVNLFLDRAGFARRLFLPPPARAGRDADKTIVEHTAINPNKAAHVGHLRNAALGDTLVRVLRFLGVPVEVQNYIDDTGVQVADVVVGLQHLERLAPDAVAALADRPRFDHYCWDLYARVTAWYEADQERLKYRTRALHDLERGADPTAEVGRIVADRIVRRHLATMRRMNIDYDLLTWEGDILRLRFWARAFEVLRAADAIHLETAGPQAGCWVMPIEGAGGDANDDADGSKDTVGTGDPGDAGPAGADDATASGSGPKSRNKVIVRSNGTVTYVGKDIAYQFWKFGLLGRDFRYRPHGLQASGRMLWTTTDGDGSERSGQAVDPGPSPPPAGRDIDTGSPAHPSFDGDAAPAAAPNTDTGGHAAERPSFGGAAAVYNVIDTRQSYLQQLLRQALAAAGQTAAAERSVHVSYEMVALSRRTAETLGYTTEAGDGRRVVEVSGRKGLGVKADDLLDRLTAAARREVLARHADLADDADGADAIATAIATAAIRYFMIKYSRGKLIAFDIDEALSFEGESGPYVQYAAVRAANILRKLYDRDGLTDESLVAALGGAPTAPLDAAGDGTTTWALLLEAARLDEVADQAVRALELSVLAKYAFGLAQQFNTFYHRCPVVAEEDEPTRLWRAAAVLACRRQLTQALALMGCDAPPRM